MIKNLPVGAGDLETQVRSMGWEDPLKEGGATHSVMLPGESSGQSEPGKLQSIGAHRVGHD